MGTDCILEPVATGHSRAGVKQVGHVLLALFAAKQ